MLNYLKFCPQAEKRTAEVVGRGGGQAGEAEEQEGEEQLSVLLLGGLAGGLGVILILGVMGGLLAR